MYFFQILVNHLKFHNAFIIRDPTHDIYFVEDMKSCVVLIEGVVATTNACGLVETYTNFMMRNHTQVHGVEFIVIVNYCYFSLENSLMLFFATILLVAANRSMLQHEQRERVWILWKFSHYVECRENSPQWKLSTYNNELLVQNKKWRCVRKKVCVIYIISFHTYST